MNRGAAGSYCIRFMDLVCAKEGAVLYLFSISGEIDNVDITLWYRMSVIPVQLLIDLEVFDPVISVFHFFPPWNLKVEFLILELVTTDK